LIENAKWRRQMRGALYREIGKPLEVRDDLEIDSPAEGQVQIRLTASGVCHSDLSLRDGTFPFPVPSPSVFGHEGAGEVVAVGQGVTTLAEGDHVIMAWVAPCGSCRFCLGGQANLCMAARQRAAESGPPPPSIHAGNEAVSGSGTFAELANVSQRSAIKIPDDVPLDVAALVGCGVMTGVGAAILTAKVEPGSSVAVIGCGGVGMNVIQGARIAGAAEIVAVDTIEAKRASALRFGATHAVAPGDLGDLSADLTRGVGFDYAFEVIGRAETIREAWDITRRGGTTVVVGAGDTTSRVSFSPNELYTMDRKLLGCVYGSADVRFDFNRVLRLWRYGKVDLEGLVGRRIEISQINEALEALETGTESIRSLIVY
jgi:S-(hydroxymethyl)glutathione dehydrogenase/alcohol dehydrogenase